MWSWRGEAKSEQITTFQRWPTILPPIDPQSGSKGHVAGSSTDWRDDDSTAHVLTLLIYMSLASPRLGRITRRPAKTLTIVRRRTLRRRISWVDRVLRSQLAWARGQWPLMRRLSHGNRTVSTDAGGGGGRFQGCKSGDDTTARRMIRCSGRSTRMTSASTASRRRTIATCGRTV